VCLIVIIRHITSRAAQEQHYGQDKNAEWVQKAAQSTCAETSSFLIPIETERGNLGDMFDQIPKELISKVMLEEKVFRTWHSGRTVLLGDTRFWAILDYGSISEQTT